MIPALLVATALFVGSVVCHAVVIAFIIRLIGLVLRRGFAGGGFGKNVAILVALSLLLTAGHLLQIAIWAGGFLACGEFDTFGPAFYHSATNFTTLGYGDVVMSARWRLLGPLEAVNGVLLLGLSTAAMFAVLSRLMEDRRRRYRTSEPRP